MIYQHINQFINCHIYNISKYFITKAFLITQFFQSVFFLETLHEK
jgi:hypothetical protein